MTAVEQPYGTNPSVKIAYTLCDTLGVDVKADPLERVNAVFREATGGQYWVGGEGEERYVGTIGADAFEWKLLHTFESGTFGLAVAGLWSVDLSGKSLVCKIEKELWLFDIEGTKFREGTMLSDAPEVAGMTYLSWSRGWAGKRVVTYQFKEGERTWAGMASVDQPERVYTSAKRAELYQPMHRHGFPVVAAGERKVVTPPSISAIQRRLLGEAPPVQDPVIGVGRGTVLKPLCFGEPLSTGWKALSWATNVSRPWWATWVDDKAKFFASSEGREPLSLLDQAVVAHGYFELAGTGMTEIAGRGIVYAVTRSGMVVTWELLPGGELKPLHGYPEKLN